MTATSSSADPAAGRTVRVDGKDVPLIRFTGPIASTASIVAALAQAGLPAGRRPVVVLVGGADGLSTGGSSRWQALFLDGLVAGLVRTGACLVDGGTDSGVIALAAAARAAAGASYPAVGVMAEGTVHWPGRAPVNDQAARIGSQHTHLVAVPGRSWGMEPPWISRVASALAGRRGSVTVVINGGPITIDDVRHSLQAGRRILVVAGTGRLADTLAATHRGQAAGTQPEQALASSPLVQVVDGLSHPRYLADAIAAALGEPLSR